MTLIINKDRVKAVYGAVDWGFTNPGIMQIWLTDYDDRLYLFRELYATRKIIDWWIERGVEFRDMYGVREFVCDPAEPAFIQQFNNAGLVAVPANNDVNAGIHAVQSRLRVQPDGKPRLFVIRSSRIEMDIELKDAGKPTSTLEEIPGYVWDSHHQKEKPIKVDDHGVDALRYMVMHLDDPSLSANQAVMRRSNMSNARSSFQRGRKRR